MGIDKISFKPNSGSARGSTARPSHKGWTTSPLAKGSIKGTCAENSLNTPIVDSRIRRNLLTGERNDLTQGSCNKLRKTKFKKGVSNLP
jgi:hypothetical protein